MEFLKNNLLIAWMPILISLFSLIMTFISENKTNKHLKKTEKENEEKYIKSIQFDLLKEDNNKRFNNIQKALLETNTRAMIMPHFSVSLKDDRIIKTDNNLVFGIGLINVGTQSATNIQLSPECPSDDLSGYFTSESFPKNQYYIHKYLSKYYAMATEEVTFDVKVDLTKINDINDFLKFKIKYTDLIGNEYEQEFRVGLYTINGLTKYNLNNYSSKSKLLEKVDVASDVMKDEMK